MSDFLAKRQQRYAKKFHPIRRNRPSLTLSFRVDEKVFSESDREALNFAWKPIWPCGQIRAREIDASIPGLEATRVLATKQSRYASADELPRFSGGPPTGNIEPCYPLAAETRKAIASGIDGFAAFERCGANVCPMNAAAGIRVGLRAGTFITFDRGS